MSNFSLLQVIIVVLLFALIFGDIPKIASTLKKLIKNFTKIKNDNRKKGN